ncbi:MAG: tetratricopeptide repeat protein [Spirochaetaceae bacterium]|jgi:tetratricopeptide (TPR) repeat protein|nr:tetratricopeptide repeat protein [Spirochaetaceae bacterium]
MRGTILIPASGCGLWTPEFQSVLTKAARLARRGNYETAIQLLESEVYNYRDSFMFFYLLGICCLYSGNYGGAHDYLTRAREIKTREPSVLLALAALYVKRADSRRAISFYLEVQEIDGKNRTARKALKILRKYAGSDDLLAWIESGKLRGLYPPLPRERFKPVKIIRNIILPCFVIIALAGVVIIRSGKFPVSADSRREGFIESGLTQNDKKNPVEMGGIYHFILTEKQILTSYDNARNFFYERRDNSARIEINRILESNANSGIKNKARIMERYLEEPGFETLKSKSSENIAYTEVVKTPLLYRDCYVLWSGMAANIDEGQDETSFDFLIGYDKRRSIEGIVKVNLNFAADINPEYPLEVLGKIVPVELPEALRLEGVTIHQLAMTK